MCRTPGQPHSASAGDERGTPPSAVGSCSRDLGCQSRGHGCGVGGVSGSSAQWKEIIMVGLFLKCFQTYQTHND